MLGLGAVVQFDLDVVQVDDDPVDDGADELSLLGAVHVLVQDVEGLEYAMELLEIELLPFEPEQLGFRGLQPIPKVGLQSLCLFERLLGVPGIGDLLVEDLLEEFLAIGAAAPGQGIGRAPLQRQELGDGLLLAGSDALFSKSKFSSLSLSQFPTRFFSSSH